MNRASLVGHALELFELIDRNTQPADRLSSDFFHARKYLGSHDRRFVSETVFGMIRHRRMIEALLEEYIAGNPGSDDLDASHNRYLPLFMAYAVGAEHHSAQREVAQNLPEALWRTYFPKHDLPSFVSWLENHKTLPLPDFDQFVRWGVRYSFQDWMVREWGEQLGDETDRLLQAMNNPAPVTLRVNRRKATREECQARLRAEGIETDPARISPVGLLAAKRFNVRALESFREGWYEVQDEGSQIISLVANPQPGEFVIDACAGAGGKSLHMADMMGDAGNLVAIDVDAKRLSELKMRSERAGVGSIHILLRHHVQPEQYHAKADLVLVDAPCSGVGTIRRNPGFKWSVTESLVSHYAGMQREILQGNAPFVKPGGKLVYTTCSLLRKENENVVEEFLGAHPDFRLLTPADAAPFLEFDPSEKHIRLFPHRQNTDGFFIAAMRRM